MGLAATQARFLTCTAKKTNIEFQGQQINEQRTLLANQSSAIYSQMLTLKVPTPPSQANFTKVAYACTINGISYSISEKEINKILSAYQDKGANKIDGSKSTYYRDAAVTTGGDVKLSYTDINGVVQTKTFFSAIRKNSTDTEVYPNSYDNLSGRLSNIYLSSTIFSGGDQATADKNYESGKVALTPNESMDEKAYNDAYNQYKYDQYVYEQALEQINAKTVIIQQQDKTLELQLKQLDTEQNAIKTEIEALSKVIKDNVESSYKTFGG